MARLPVVPQGEGFLPGRGETLLEGVGLGEQRHDQVVELDEPGGKGARHLHGELEGSGVFAAEEVLEGGLVHREDAQRRDGACGGTAREVQEQADLAEDLARTEVGDGMVHAIGVAAEHLDAALHENHHAGAEGTLFEHDGAALPVLQAPHVHEPAEFVVRQRLEQRQGPQQAGEFRSHPIPRLRVGRVGCIHVALAWCAGCVGPVEDPVPRQVVLVTVHALPGGDPVEQPDLLPALAAAAGDAVRYRRATAAAPTALAALGTLVTGAEPRRHGLFGPGLQLDPTLPTVAERLAAQGWATRAVATDLPGGAWFGLDRGFQQVRICDDADDAIEVATAGAGGRDFLWVHVGGDVVADVDQRAARLVTRLRARPDVAVVLVGDRGAGDDPFGIGPALREVPLVLWAGGAPRVEGLAAGVDVAATLLALAGQPDRVDGADLRGAGSAVARVESAAPCALGAVPGRAVIDADGAVESWGESLTAYDADGRPRPLQAADTARVWVTTDGGAPVELAADIDPDLLLAAFTDGEWPLWPGACAAARGAHPPGAAAAGHDAAMGLHRRAIAAVAGDALTPAVAALAAATGIAWSTDGDDALSALSRFLVAERAGDDVGVADAAEDLAAGTGERLWIVEAALARRDHAALARIAGDPRADAASVVAEAIVALHEGDPIGALGVGDLPPFWAGWVSGHAHVARGDDRAAIQGFLQALRAAPERRGPRLALAEAWLRVGRPAQAWRALAPVDDAAKADPVWQAVRRRVLRAVEALD